MPYVPAARVAKTLHAFGFPNYMTDGSFNARLRVGGRSLAPTIGGHVEVPAGDVNGLPFVDASAQIVAGNRGVSIHQGSVVVGTTAASFTAVAQPGETEIDVNAPHADLSDFNNFFDTGDTLDGSGSLKIAADAKGSRVTSSGNIDVRGFRYRNLPIGDTRAIWASAKNAIDGDLAVGGAQGMLRARGSIGLTPSHDWQTMLTNTRFNLAASVENLDLSLWMPALGMQSVPITGRASGDADGSRAFSESQSARQRARQRRNARAADARSRRALAAHRGQTLRDRQRRNGDARIWSQPRPVRSA